MEQAKPTAPVSAVAPAEIKQADNNAEVTAKSDPKLELFARKEKALQKMRMELDAERKALESKRSEYETSYIPKSKIAEDPLTVLNEAGLDYNKLTELILNQPNQNDPTIRALRAEIKSISEKQAKAEQAAQEATTKQYQNALKQIGNEVKFMVDADKDGKFGAIKEMGMQDAVVELIESTWNETGRLMDNEEAAAQIEDSLIAEAERLFKISKIKSKLQTEQKIEPVVAKQTQTPTIKTITQSMPTGPAKTSSTKERKERAMAAFYGKLNQ